MTATDTTTAGYDEDDAGTDRPGVPVDRWAMFTARAALLQLKLAVTTPGTKTASNLLSDIAGLDPQIERGRRAVMHSSPNVDLAVDLAGISSLVHDNETEQDVRDAIRAYAHWLLQVADKAL